MKLKHLSILALGALAFTACSDDDKAGLNTAAGVTVSMAESTIRISEDQLSNTTFNYITVDVDGEANGDIYVTLDLAPYGEHGATADKNYIMTSQRIRIPAGEKTGRFQYYPVGDNIINDDRSFEAKIAKVEGASVGADASTVVTLVDNEGLIPIYYPGLGGLWSAAMYSNDGQNVYQNDFQIQCYPEGDDNYGKAVKLVGFPEPASTMMSQNNVAASFSVDGVEQAIYLTVEMGQQVGTFTHPTYGVGKVFIYPCSSTSYWSTGTFTFKFNFDLKSGEMLPDDQDRDFGILISFSAGMMLYEGYTAMEFSR
ncbi:MAG: hypothetical protein K2N28_07825 [Muribaculaceae bacterium]|nr:hypothetical protein [Muribaculaceae bacterium]